MKMIAAAILASGLTLSSSAMAQDADFSLTYHVERTPAARLSIDACAQAVTKVARQARLPVSAQRYPGQLVLVKGGQRGVGAFITQCIAVDGKTVSVVQGIDYRAQRGAMGNFADRAFAAIKAAAR
ncbi:DUF6180 family protein [uncultured Sphingomonas sp.]|uniref:DUF6180 family protein n=1 Tax=uncultured Sphingomonas sp. TaxID=158754 RepID=UPI0025FE2443|nr:DUF6180 family protein [uncultured Sphingomonas sp.]